MHFGYVAVPIRYDRLLARRVPEAGKAGRWWITWNVNKETAVTVSQKHPSRLLYFMRVIMVLAD